MRILAALLVLAFLAGCSTSNTVVVNLEPTTGDIAPPEPTVPGMTIASVKDARGVPQNSLGTARRHSSPVPMLSNQPVTQVVREALELALPRSASGDPAPLDITIDWLDLQESAADSRVYVYANVALRFAFSGTDREYSTERRTRVSVSGNADSETREALFTAIQGCAQNFMDQLAGIAPASNAGEPMALPEPPRFRRRVLATGFGYETGGVGFTGEWHLGESGRFSVTAGIGRVHLGGTRDVDYAKEWAWNVGTRYYLDDGKHRMFIGATTGPVEWSGIYTQHQGEEEYEVTATHYGAGVGFGYKYTAYSGFTVPMSAYTLYLPESDEFGVGLTVAFGYSF